MLTDKYSIEIKTYSLRDEPIAIKKQLGTYDFSTSYTPDHELKRKLSGGTSSAGPIFDQNWLN